MHIVYLTLMTNVPTQHEDTFYTRFNSIKLLM